VSGATIVYLEDVTVSYDGFKALDRLSFYMDRRELRVVIGPNGAGKTTLLDVISGRVRPAAGRVIFGHHTDLTSLRENEIATLGVGRKFQTPSVFGNLTVWDNVDLSLRRESKGVFAALLDRGGTGPSGIGSPRLSARWDSTARPGGWPGPCPTGRRSGWRSGWSCPRSRSSCSSTSRSRG